MWNITLHWAEQRYVSKYNCTSETYVIEVEIKMIKKEKYFSKPFLCSVTLPPPRIFWLLAPSVHTHNIFLSPPSPHIKQFHCYCLDQKGLNCAAQMYLTGTLSPISKIYLFRAYIMQKGCASRFLHGPGTDQDKVGEIEKALEAKTELQVEIQFYRKNGNE